VAFFYSNYKPNHFASGKGVKSSFRSSRMSHHLQINHAPLFQILVSEYFQQ